MKIYARQINPEYQESPLFTGPEFWPDNIAVFGNRYFNEHKCEVFVRVQEVLEAGELADFLEDFEIRGRSEWYKNITEAINDLLPAEKGKYSTRDIHALKRLIPMYNTYDREKDTLCEVLSIVTGKKWEYRIIRGAVQGDWNELFYQKDDWSRDALDAFETEYFNTGSEWIIHDGENAPEDPEDVNGYSVYCTSWNNAGILEELAAASGESPDGAVLWAWDSYKRINVYKRLEV